MECLGCSNGVAMCHNRPCMGEPKDFDKIIDAGFADKLRIDYWAGLPPSSKIKFEDTIGSSPFVELQKILYDYQQINPNPHEKDVQMLSGGTANDKGYYSSFMPTGKCNFLTKDEKCELHNLGLKPEQGKESCCESNKHKAKGNLHYANLWATEEGLAVIEKFKKSVNIN